MPRPRERLRYRLALTVLVVVAVAVIGGITAACILAWSTWGKDSLYVLGTIAGLGVFIWAVNEVFD